MNPMVAFFTLIQNGIYLLNSVHFLIEVLVCLKVLDILLTHTNLKTWLAKAKWGVKYALEKTAKLVMRLDSAILRFMDK